MTNEFDHLHDADFELTDFEKELLARAEPAPPSFYDLENVVKTFLIDLDAGLPCTNSKDPLRIVYRGSDVNHFAASYSPVFWYSVTNLKKGGNYAVHFFCNQAGDIVASCDCVARKICKHIIKAWEIHAEAVERGFVPAFKCMENANNDQ